MGRPVRKDVNGTEVFGRPVEPEGIQTFTVTNSGASAYVIDGENNPTLNLFRGFTYEFNVDASGHPFWIQTVSGSYSSENVYNDGVTNNGAAVGTITFQVPLDAPDTLYYVCQFHGSMAGTINITDPVIQGVQVSARLLGSSEAKNGFVARQTGAKSYQITNADGTSKCVLVESVTGAGQVTILGFTSADVSVAIKKLQKRTAIDFSGNRYTWVLVNDSSADYIQLTPIV
jgi:hypothetical protein